MPASYQQLLHWHQQLESLDSTNCVFEHHKGEEDREDNMTNPLCPSEVQNRRHGCAHAMHYILKMVIHEMREAGELAAVEATSLSTRISHQKHALSYDLDFVIALEVVTDAKYQQIKCGQKEIIDHRVESTKALLAKIRDRIAEFPISKPHRIALSVA